MGEVMVKRKYEKPTFVAQVRLSEITAQVACVSNCPKLL
jgi:hypothetical protein